MQKIKDILKKITASKKLLFSAAGGFAAVVVSLVIFIVSVNSNNIPETAPEIEISSDMPQSEPLYEETEETDEYDEYDEYFEYFEEDEEQSFEQETSGGGNTGAKFPSQPQPSATKKYYSYLTGKRVSRAQQQKRPVSVIINNIRQAMPTVGLSYADIIYECMVEGGITRLMPVFSNYEDIPAIGSIRSSREYFIDLSRSHDTIYVHAGGNPQDYEQLHSRPVSWIDGVNQVDKNGRRVTFPETFYRDSERRKTMSLEHTLMTSGEGIIAAADKMNYKKTLDYGFTPPFKFNEKFVDIGSSGNTAYYACIPYSSGFSAEFIYDLENKLYYRKQYGAAHIDGGNGEQLKFENVIVIFAEYTPFRGNATAIKEGHYKCELTGEGYGFYINGGKYKVIRWKKDTRESAMNLYELNRLDLYLNPGKSFICVISTAYNKSVAISGDIMDYK